MENKFCQRCKKYHNSPPVDPKKIIQDHARDIAKQIDKQILEEILNG